MAATFREMGWEDREVKVRRGELLEVLRKNREQPARDYTAACAGYREQALTRIDEIFGELRAKITGLKDGQTVAVVGLQFGLNVPQSYERAYDQIIRMMEMSVDDEIVLTGSQFACFVMDDWDWKEQWSASNATYLGKK